MIVSLVPANGTTQFQSPDGQRLILGTQTGRPLYSRGDIFYPLNNKGGEDFADDVYTIQYEDPIRNEEGVISRLGDIVEWNGITFQKIPLKTQIDVITRITKYLYHLHEDVYILVSSDFQETSHSFRLFRGPLKRMAQSHIFDISFHQDGRKIECISLKDDVLFSPDEEPTWNGYSLTALKPSGYQLTESSDAAFAHLRKI